MTHADKFTGDFRQFYDVMLLQSIAAGSKPDGKIEDEQAYSMIATAVENGMFQPLLIMHKDPKISPFFSPMVLNYAKMAVAFAFDKAVKKLLDTGMHIMMDEMTDRDPIALQRAREEKIEKGKKILGAWIGDESLPPDIRRRAQNALNRLQMPEKEMMEDRKRFQKALPRHQRPSGTYIKIRMRRSG